MSRSAMGPMWRTASRQVGVMIVAMALFGVAPVLALMMSPPKVGAAHHERLTGAAAAQFLESKMAQDEGRLAAYREAEKRLKAKGLARSGVTVTRTYFEPGQTSVTRRVAEWVVPTLHAAQYGQTMIWDDWSGYNAWYDGMIYVDDGSYHDIMMVASFSKDPSTNFLVYSVDALWWTGWDPGIAPTPVAANTDTFVARLHRVGQRIRQIAYPTLDAKEMSRSWWDRLSDWAQCTVTGCSTAASACYLSNVMDGETLWVPCFTGWCGGAEVGCAVYAIIH